jgi:hypothetical protein
VGAKNSTHKVHEKTEARFRVSVRGALCYSSSILGIKPADFANSIAGELESHVTRRVRDSWGRGSIDDAVVGGTQLVKEIT